MQSLDVCVLYSNKYLNSSWYNAPQYTYSFWSLIVAWNIFQAIWQICYDQVLHLEKVQGKRASAYAIIVNVLYLKLGLQKFKYKDDNSKLVVIYKIKSLKLSMVKNR